MTQQPALGWRLVVSGVVTVLYAVAQTVYRMFEGPIEAQAAVGQLQDSPVGYSASRAIASGEIMNLVGWIVVAILVFVWGSYLLRVMRRPADTR